MYNCFAYIFNLSEFHLLLAEIIKTKAEDLLFIYLTQFYRSRKCGVDFTPGNMSRIITVESATWKVLR